MNYFKSNASISLSWSILLVLFIFIFFIGATVNLLAQGYSEYPIQEDDSLWTIIRQFQLSIQEVTQVNNVEQNQPLTPDQLIEISKNEENNSNSSRVISTVTHTAQSSESFWDIIQQYRLSLEQISSVKDLNRIDSFPISQEIRIPTDNTEKGKAKIEEEQSGLSYKKGKLNYQETSTSLKQELNNLAKKVNSTVQAEESLWSIIQSYQASLRDLSSTDDLENFERLTMSQIIKRLPNSSAGNEENETKESNGKGSLQDITQPSVGQKLDLPAYEQAAEQKTGTSVAQTEKTKKSVVHFVQKGETLWQISRKYQVSVQSISSANQISENGRLIVGQKLVIPDARSSLISSHSFIWPLNGQITSQFGIRTLGNRRDYHTGIDIDAPAEALIKAAESGKVSFSGYINGYGNVVIIDHGEGYFTVYAHSTSNLVKEGQNVTKGQVICRVGSTGHATGSHLHFEIRENGRPVNPLDYLP